MPNDPLREPRKARAISVTKRAGWILLSLLVLGLLAWPKLAVTRSGQAATPARVSAPTDVVGIVVRAERISETVRTTGSLLANEQVRLVAEVSGRITGVYFREGTPVAAGALLVKLNDAELQARRQSILARQRVANAVEQRRAQLLKTQSVSQEEYDQIRNEVNLLHAELGLVDAQIAQTEIRAPFSGVVGLRAVSPGSYVSPQTPVATLRQVSPLKLEFDIPERHADRIRVGTTIRFRTNRVGRSDQARIYALEPGIDAGTRSLRVRALANNPGGLLRPGEFADVELELMEVQGAVLVPTTALVSGGGRNSVYIAKNGVAETRPVTLGVRTADRIQIVSGLTPGDTVITLGTQVVRSGAKIRLALP